MTGPVVVSAAALASAESMGRNAGELFAAGGGPTPNPFTRSDPSAVLEPLAQAWRQAYFTAMGLASG